MKRIRRLWALGALVIAMLLIPVAAQAQRVTASYENEPIEKVINDLKKKTNYDIVYDNEVVKDCKPITGSVDNLTIADALDKLLNGTGIEYSISSKTIVLRKESKKDYGNTKRKITGKVIDEEGEPLPGVSIRIKNSKVATTTNIDGNFSIIVDLTQAKSQVLDFSYIGMEPRSVTVTSKTPSYVKVMMEINANKFDEVVVTGYQSMSRRELASAITTVKAKEVVTPSAMSIDQMLQGRIPGMAVMTQSGEPSSTPTIRIRGNSTINGNKAPVWVVDGVIMSDPVEFSASDLNSPDAAYLIGNSISGLSPQDIETITVLKDASATAIYGVKAANGVIVVTTKRGQESAPQVTYDGSVNINTRPSYSQFDVMNSQERVQLSRDNYEARLQYPRVPADESYEGVLMKMLNKQITPEEYAALVRRYETMNTDWFGELFRTAVTQNHNVSINGGTERIRYYNSLSYNNSPGIAKGSESHRFTALSKLYVKLSRIFDFDLKLEISTQSNQGYYSGVNPFNYAFNTSRAIPMYNEDGSLYYYNRASLSTRNYTYNILNEIGTTGQKSKNRRMGGVFNLNAHIIDGLTYTGTFSYYWNTNRVDNYATDHSYVVGSERGYDFGKFQKGDNEYETSRIPQGGMYGVSNTMSRFYTARNTLNYIQTFADKHDVNLFAGIEVRSDKYSGNTWEAWGWDPMYGQSFSPVATDQYLRLVTNGRFLPTITETTTQVASYLGSASYTYDSRYIVNANIRSDGANKFGSNPKYRWLPTWSFAGKWIASNEKFLRQQTWINNLAVRASYGLQGNIHDASTPYLIASMGAIDDVTGFRPGTIRKLPNPDLRWEKTHSWNIGLDAAFFNGRLSFTFDVYHKKTKDLITDMKVSPSTGMSYMSMNVGDAINKGYEGVVSVDILRGRLFDWNASFNFSHNTNEIRYAFEGGLTEKETFQNMLSGNVAQIGEPLGTIYSFKYAGLSHENGYPLFYAKDGRKVHEGDYAAMELVPSGSIYPDFTGGFDTRVTFKKNLSVAIGFSYQIGGVKRLPAIYNGATNAFDPLTNLPKVWNNRWRQPGDEAHTNVPALYDATIANSFPDELVAYYSTESHVREVSMSNMYDQSDARVASTDFLRLRNITVSYRLPQVWLRQIGVRECTVRLQGSNLHTWCSSKWNGQDPETAYANMPLQPSYSFGLNLSF